MPSLILIKSPGGAETGKTSPLDGDSAFVIGRDERECPIWIPPPHHSAVSRQHARIVRAEGRYFLEDLNSRNGTFLNQTKVTTRTPLKNEDRIKICDFLFRFKDERAGDLDPDEPDDEAGPEGLTTVQHSHSAG